MWLDRKHFGYNLKFCPEVTLRIMIYERGGEKAVRPVTRKWSKYNQKLGGKRGSIKQARDEKGS